MAQMYCQKCKQSFDPTITPPKREIGRTKVHRIFCPLCGVPDYAINFTKPLPMAGMGVPMNTQKMGTEQLGSDGRPLTPSQKWVLENGVNMFAKGGQGIPISVPRIPMDSWMPRVAAKLAQIMDDVGAYDQADLTDSIALLEP